MEETRDDVALALKRRLNGRRFALLGMGNIDKGDDGFGVRLVEQLKERYADAPLFACGTAPENYLGPLVKSKPRVIVIVDAAHLGAEPGHTHLIEKNDIASIGLSTHDTSLRLFIAYVEESLANADIVLLGVQPKHTAIGSAMSEELKHVLAVFGQLFAEMLS
jgi:hydrogenase 3 maturation protease